MFRKLALFSALVALFVIVLGSYVRLTDAGLGCPDWPGCYGKAIVGGDDAFKSQAEQRFPDAPLDSGKAWKEMTHRYAAGLLGVLALLMALLSWRVKHCRWLAVSSSAVLLLLIAAQAALGMWTVTLKVMPIVVTSHLLLGFITFWTIVWMYWRTDPVLTPSGQRHLGLRSVTLLAMLVLLAQIVLGGWTSTNYAALACTDFPRCNGQWLPSDADFGSALSFFSGLETGYKGVLSYQGQLAAHWLHRVGALITFLMLTLVMLMATSAHYSKQVRKAGLILSVLLLVQITLGILNVRLSLPLWSAVAHNGFAALLMLPLIAIRLYARYGVVGEAKAEVEAVAAAVPAEAEEVYVEAEPESLYRRLQAQLQRTRSGLGGVLATLPLGQKNIDEDLLEEIEASLLMADVGIEATSEIINRLTESLERNQLDDAEALKEALKQDLYEMLQPCSQPLVIPEQEGPFVILVVGINGAGKTTSIGKLAKRLQGQGHSVMLAAGDTFRAAAVEQLQTWGERNNIQVVAQHTGADSASVIFDGVQSAKAKGVDVLIADTAGRLHTKSNLMEELSKIKRIMAKLDESAPHEVLLVLDAGTGQNALSQAKLFNDAVQLTGIALTKLDGTAKGGVIFALAKQMGVPIRFIGIGEGIDDLQDFDAKTFVDALFVQD
ncbi:signal recognition particle-docking protein FtsY [Methylomarinum sp. Ch1-1]|uniref:Signal recognition particle receptor FtsY n=1 Tax=Methylomarinum roseum TaxID=3067653 RepID=A0AAU7NPA3_9GAMM|nr:signal recognition particle-docking protein FtsY [Methylomarinum sp. Ch1-1]MDP4521332.1 signal recognition particle-docking protein FtsY [Methylomarinum sp. Ch1-1]